MKHHLTRILFILTAFNIFSQQAVFSQTPDLAWKFKANDAFVSSPVIDNGVVYAGSTDSNMYAIELNSGNLKWKFKTGGPIRSTACISDSGLFFISGDGLYNLNKTDGTLRNQYKTKELQYDVYDYFQCSPVIQDGKLFWGSSDSAIYSFNPSAFNLIWKYKTDGMVHTRCTFGKGKLFTGSFDGNLYAINVENGQLSWKFKSLGHDFFPKGEMEFPPTYANGMVYIGGRDYNLYAIDADKGFNHWNRAFPEGWVTSITLSPKSDSILFVGTSDPQVLICMDGIYGADKWKTGLKSSIFGNCVYYSNMIYVGTSNGKLFCIDSKTGKIVWTFVTESFTANHFSYLKPDDSNLDDITSLIKTGDDYIIMCKKLGGIFNSPAITGEYIIFSSMNGCIYCLKKTT
jgi:eukaryotic-like serine/threonine-protein kinase